MFFSLLFELSDLCVQLYSFSITNRFRMYVQLQGILLLASDIISNIKIRYIDWSCSDEMTYSQFIQLYGCKQVNLLDEFVSHGLITYTINQEGNGFCLKVVTTCGNFSVTAFHAWEVALAGILFRTKAGRKILYQAHLYRAPLCVDELQNNCPEYLQNRVAKAIEILYVNEDRIPPASCEIIGAKIYDFMEYINCNSKPDQYYEI